VWSSYYKPIAKNNFIASMITAAVVGTTFFRLRAYLGEEKISFIFIAITAAATFAGCFLLNTILAGATKNARQNLKQILDNEN